jgi:thiol-disulfide isomerase/thioredoxin
MRKPEYVTRTPPPPPIRTQALDSLRSDRSMIRALNGISTSLLPADSVTVLLFLVDTCPACKMHMPTYPALAAAARENGYAFRAVVSYEIAVPEHLVAEISPSMPVLLDEGHRIRQALDVSAVPSALVVMPGAGAQHRLLLPGPDWPRPDRPFTF